VATRTDPRSTAPAAATIGGGMSNSLRIRRRAWVVGGTAAFGARPVPSKFATDFQLALV
jgi:hypothetical protein